MKLIGAHLCEDGSPCAHQERTYQLAGHYYTFTSLQLNRPIYFGQGRSMLGTQCSRCGKLYWTGIDIMAGDGIDIIRHTWDEIIADPAAVIMELLL